MDNTVNQARRKMLGMAALLSVVAADAATGVLAAGSSVSASDERRLRFYNTHNREELDVVYFSHGEYRPSSLRQLNHLLRDHRRNEATIMDTGLFDQLWSIQQKLGSSEVFEIISGYRTPATNKMLSKRSKKVAKKSYHMRGRAIDIRLRGTDTTRLRDTAMSMHAGGVGYYQRSNFVHLDTGPARSWG